MVFYLLRRLDSLPNWLAIIFMKTSLLFIEFLQLIHILVLSKNILASISFKWNNFRVLILLHLFIFMFNEFFIDLVKEIYRKIVELQVWWLAWKFDRESNERLNSLGDLVRHEVTNFLIRVSHCFSSDITFFFSFGESDLQIIKVLTKVVVFIKRSVVSWRLLWPFLFDGFFSQFKLNHFLQFIVGETRSVS